MPKDDIEFYSNSKLDSAIYCPRNYYFSWERRIESAEPGVHIHTDFGTCLHSGCATFYRQAKLEPEILKGKGAFDLAVSNAIQTFTDEFTDLDQDYHSSKNLETGVLALEEFFSNPAYYDLGEVLLVEEDLRNPILRFAGKIDLVTRVGKRIYIIDHKTTARFYKNTFEKWQQNRAFMGYRWLVEGQFPGYDRYISHVNLFHCITQPKILTKPYEFSKFQIEEWGKTTRHYINQIEWFKRNNFWPKAAVRCQTYGCEFQFLCDQNKTHDEVVLPATYRHRKEWYV